jgi:hypothetical protein
LNATALRAIAEPHVRDFGLALGALALARLATAFEQG